MPLFSDMGPGDLTATSGAFIFAYLVLAPLLFTIGIIWLGAWITNRRRPDRR